MASNTEWMETYEFPGWDRCLRCLCHMSDECPDLEYLYSLQQAQDDWNALSDEEKEQYELEAAMLNIVKVFSGVLAPDEQF